MAPPRSLNFLRVGTGPHVLELYLDPICPFSAKATRGLDKHVLPFITKGGKYEGKLSVIARLYPQPFHYYSFIVIEALYLFGSKHPESFWPYLLAVYDNQKEFFNVPAQALSMGQARDRLTEIALSVLEEKGALPAGPKSKVFGELRDAMEVRQTADGGINGGNASLDDIKFLMKVGRQNSIHVTPTALFDGLEEKGVSSSFGQEEWDKFLAGKIGDE